MHEEAIVGKVNIFDITRRCFLKIAGLSSAAFMFSNPLKLFASTAASYPYRILDFAQTSDVHLVDEGNSLRFEELSLLGIIPFTSIYGPLTIDRLIESSSRAQDAWSAVIWNATIESINEEHEKQNMDFHISTGDHTDTNLENEIRWFVEIADGYVSWDYTERTNADKYGRDALKPFIPAGLKLPWYATLGNHDTEYQGTANTEILIKHLTPLVCGDARDLCDQDDAIETYKISQTSPWWHGFANMPEPTDGYTKQEGYYSFEPKPYIHCIVLNTSNFNPEKGLPVQSIARGVLDKRQFKWMVDEIEAHPDKLILIFSHHPANPNHGLSGWDSCQSPVDPRDFIDTLCSYENVIAHITGHTHYNRVEKLESEDGQIYDINTCAIIDWPQEWRRITVRVNEDCTSGILSCRMHRYDTEKNRECFEISCADSGAGVGTSEGTPEDRNVDLPFSIPELVAASIADSLPEDGLESEDNPEDAETTSSSDNCFIATAAYGSLMEPEVMSLRRFRDTTLKNSGMGKLFIRTYYRLSPPIARFIAKRPGLRALVRCILRPVIRMLG